MTDPYIGKYLGPTGLVTDIGDAVDIRGPAGGGGSGSGDVVGPTSAINNNIVVFDGTTGTLIKDSGQALSSYLSTSTASTTYVPQTRTVNGKALSSNITLTYADIGSITLTGDITGTGTGSFATTLATVNSSTGTYGSASQVGTFTVNGKGLITAAGNASIQITESQVTGLVSDLAGKQASLTVTTTGTSGAATLVGGTLNIPNYATGGGSPTGSAGGDLTGTYPNPTIANAAVTYAKIQNVTTQTLLGRYAGTTGVAQEITIGSGLTLNTTTGVLSAPTGGGGDALTTNPLSQFASTTSSQLRGVLSDETGTGAAVFANSPTLVTPIGIVKGDVGLGNVDNTSDATVLASAASAAASASKSADTIVDGTTNKAYTATEKTKLAAITGTNTGDQTSIVGITGTKAQFNTAVTDGDILYVGDAYVPGGTDVAVTDGGTGVSTLTGFFPEPWTYVLSGPLITDAVTTGTKLSYRVVKAFTLLAADVSLDVVTAPTGSALTANIKKNGTTVYSSLPTVGTSQISSTSGTGSAVGTLSTSPASFAVGDIVVVSIDQVGATVAGAGVSLSVIKKF